MKIYAIEFSDIFKMAAMPIYGKIFKIFFSRTNGLITLELGM